MLKFYKSKVKSIHARTHLDDVIDANENDIEAIVKNVSPNERTAFRERIEIKIKDESKKSISLSEKIGKIISAEVKDYEQITTNKLETILELYKSFSLEFLKNPNSRVTLNAKEKLHFISDESFNDFIDICRKNGKHSSIIAKLSIALNILDSKPKEDMTTMTDNFKTALKGSRK